MRYGDIKEVNGKWRETNHAYFSFAYNGYPYAVIMPKVTPDENKEQIIMSTRGAWNSMSLAVTL